MSADSFANSVQAEDVYGVAGDNRGTVIQNFVSYESEVSIQSRLLIKGSPYLGLEKFAPDDKDRFFGREYWITDLSRYLLDENHNVLLLLGASGSGKSSLIGAGLIPRLKDDWGAFKNLTFVPDQNPFKSLHNCLSLLVGQSKAEMAQPDNHIDKPDLLVQVVQTLKQDQQWLIFIDQFEELFTRTLDSERDRFVESLVRLIQAYQQDHSLKIVLTMRADFLDRLSPYPELGKIHDHRSRMLTDMSEGELTLAIKEPAARNGVVFESKLIEEIIGDYRGGAGSLPLLQYTLDLLWKNDDINDRVLNTATYKQLGGVTGALQTQANKIYAELNQDQKNTVKKIFFELIGLANAQPVSRRTPKSQFLDGGTQQTVLELLIEKRLLVSRGEGQQATVEVAHEALLRTWEVLQQLIQDRKDIIVLRDQLMADAKRWQEQRKQNEQKAQGDLWSGWKLDRVLEWQATQVLDCFEPDVQAFIEASRCWRDEQAEKDRIQAEKDRKVARRIAVGSTIAAGLMTVAALFSTIQVRRVEIRQVQGFQKAAEANRLAGEELEAVINSLRAGKALQDSWLGISYDPALRVQVLTELHETLFAAQEHNRLNGHEGPVNHVDFSPDGQHLATTSDDDTARIWDISGKTVAILEGHTDDVNCIHYSPDGKNIITCSDDETARIWDSSGKEIAVLTGHEDAINSITYSPDGKYIATSSDDGTTRIWNTKGEEVRELVVYEDGEVQSQIYSPDKRHLATRGRSYTDDAVYSVHIWDTLGEQDPVVLEHPSYINDFDYSPDGKYLATVAGDGTGRIWDTTGKQVAVLQGHKGDIWRVRYSPDGTRLATGGEDGTVRIWDTSGRQLFELKGHLSGVNRVLYGEQYIASAGTDGTVRLWTTSGRLIADLRGNEESISNMAYSPGGKYLATVGQDSTVRLWDLAARQDVEFDRYVEDSPNGKYVTLYEGDGQNQIAHIRDINTGNEIELRGRRYPISYIEYSPDEKSLVIREASEDSENQIYRLWDLQANREVDLQEKQEPISHISYSPNGKYVTLYEGEGENRIVRVWDIGTGREIELKGQEYPISSVKYSPDEKSLVIREASEDSENQIVRLWDIQANREVDLKEGQEPITDVDYSPKRKYLTIYEGEEENQTVHIRDIATGSENIKLKGQKYPISSIEYSPDEKYLVITETSEDGEDEIARLWDLQANREVNLTGQKEPIRDIAYSSNWKYLAIMYGENRAAQLWDLYANREIELKGQQKIVSLVVLSPDENRLVTITSDGKASLWNTDGNQIIELKGHRSPIYSVVFAPDGQHLITFSNDSTRIRTVYELDDLMKRGCDWVKDYLETNQDIGESDRKLCEY